MQTDSRQLSPEHYTIGDLIYHAQTQPQEQISAKSVNSYASTLRQFTQELGFSTESLATDVLGEEFSAHLNQIADDKPRKSRLRQWQKLLQRLLLEQQGNAFADALKQALTDSGMSKTQLAKELDVHPKTIQSWITGQYFPQQISMVEEIEKQLELKSGQLKQVALIEVESAHQLIPESWWPENIRTNRDGIKKRMATIYYIGHQSLVLTQDKLKPIFDEALRKVENGEYLPEWRKKSAELSSLKYKLGLEDWPLPPQETWQKVSEYMTSPSGFHNESRNGMWRQKTAELYLQGFEYYFGFLTLPKKAEEVKLTGLGISKDSLGFAHLLNSQHFKAYAEFVKARSGGYPTSLKTTLAVIRQLIRPGSGYFFTHPDELENTGAFKGKTAEERQIILSELYQEMKGIQDSLKKWDGQLRETMGLITPILEHQYPRDVVLEAIEEYGYDLRRAHPTGQIATAGFQICLRWSTYLLLHMLIRFPLRVSHWPKMTYLKNNTGHLFYDKDGVLSLRLPYKEFKNEKSRRHFPKRKDGKPEEIVLPFSEDSPLGEIKELVEFYLSQVRPLLAGSDEGYVFCNQKGKRRSEIVISDTIDFWSFRYLSTYGDKRTCIEGVHSFRAHMFRHIVATDAVKNDGVEAAAALLLDDPEQVLKTYARYLPEDGIRRAFSSKAVYRPGHGVKIPEFAAQQGES